MAAEVRIKITSINEARQAIQGLGEDSKKWKEMLKQAGIPLVQQKVLLQQLQKEQKAAAREALGIGQATQSLTDKIRSGVVQAHLLGKAFEGAKKAWDTLAQAGGAKSVQELLEGSKELDDMFDQLGEKLRANGDELKNWKTSINAIAKQTNQDPKALIAGILQAQEARSAGREILGDNGALLSRFARQAFSDRAPVESTIKTGIDLMQDLKLKPQDAQTAAGVIRMSEEAGAINAKDIATKFGGTTVSLMQKQGTSGVEALRRGVAVAQVIGSAPGIAGNADLAQNRLENFLNKAIDPQYIKRIKHVTGVDLIDRKSGRLKEIPTIMEDIAKKEAKETKAGRGGKFMLDLSNAWKDAQAREGFMALYRGREQLRPLQDVSAEQGNQIFDENLKKRMGTVGNRIISAQVGAQIDFFEKQYPTMGPASARVGETVTDFNANHPVASMVAPPLLAAGAVPAGKVAVAALGGAGAAVGGAGLAAAAGTVAVTKEAADQASEGKGSFLEALANVASILGGGGGIAAPASAASGKVQVTVNVAPNIPAAVTAQVQTSKEKATAGPVVMPGR